MRSVVSRSFIFCFLLLAPAMAQAEDHPLKGMVPYWEGMCRNLTGRFPCEFYKKDNEPGVRYIAIYDQQLVGVVYVLRQGEEGETVFWRKPTRDLRVHYPQETRRH